MTRVTLMTLVTRVTRVTRMTLVTCVTRVTKIQKCKNAKSTRQFVGKKENYMQEGIRAEGPIKRWPKATSLPQELEIYARVAC